MSTTNKSQKSPNSFSNTASNNSLSSAIMVQSPQQQHSQRFSSNLCAVLNDPRKDRTKINYLFTKTWGSDFTDSERSIPSISHAHPTNYMNVFKKNDFNDYLGNTVERSLKHSKNKFDLLNPSNSITSSINQLQLNDLEQIPKIFFDPNFSLTNKDTFNAIISFELFNKKETLINNDTSNQLATTNTNPFMTNTKQLGVYEAKSCKIILDKLGIFLDIIEMHISRQISTKANTFFNAIHSQDEVQEHVLKTCTAVKNLRKNLKYLDVNVILASIRVIKLVSYKLKMLNLIEKLELMSSVYQTQPTIQLHLASLEFTGALDLIAMSQDILRQDLRGIRSLRHYDSQFTEIEKAIDKMLHQEFVRYIISDLSRDFSTGSQVFNQEKLCSLMLGILRIKTSTFVDLLRDEILVYLNSTIKQTIVEYISQIEDDNIDETDDEANIKLSDKVRLLKIQEFLHLLSKVLANIKTMLARVQSIIKIIITVVNSTAGVKEQNDNQIENIEILDAVLLTKELISKKTHSKLISDLNDTLSNASDYAQERLVNLLESKFKENSLEKLNSNDFISVSNLIEQFVLDFDLIANKKTVSLRSWLKSQANKYLQKFHQEKKDKLTLSLDTERWKQIEVSNEVQYLVENILSNGLGVNHKKLDSKVKNSKDFIIINNEKYVIFGTVIVLIKLMVDYCQLSMDIPNLCFDIMTRLIEIFKMFHSKTYQMILGIGAIQLGVLKIITFKTLAITYRSLELVLTFFPLVKDFFKQKLTDKHSNIDKQFGNLIQVYTDHKMELNNKLIFMVDDNLRELLCKYEVIAPVPSQSFRSICNQIAKVHGIVSEIMSSSILVELFTEIHTKFKERLKERLKELNVVNDGGPQHALLFADISFYIKQFKGLNGLHLISLNFEDAWANK